MKLLRRAIIAGIIILLAIGGYIVFNRWQMGKSLPEGLIQANGRIEGDEITVASKFPGRVQKLLVREGDWVKPGQILLHLDDIQTQAKVTQARANVNQTAAGLDQAEAKVVQAEHSVATLEAQVKAAQTGLATLRKEIPLNIESAEMGVNRARAMVEKAEASESQARRDAVRFRNLAEEGTADRHKSEMADLALAAAEKDLDSARSGLVQAEKQLAQAKLGWDRIQAREEEIVALDAQRKQTVATLVQAKAGVQQAKAGLAQTKGGLTEVESVLSDLVILAPAQGIVTTRVTDVGEVVAPGSPLFSLVDLDRLYLKVYVPEIHIGKIHLGLPAKIFIDAFPDRGFPATVRYISSRAEFTPKEVQTPDERVKLVYAVKLYLDENPDHRLTPGLPADAVIRWKEGVPWVKPKW